MKKMTIIALAIVATMFASCTANSTSTPNTDSTAVDSTAAQVDSTATTVDTTAAH
jgi:outer membrane murein-binding lipoprotein Lpp